MLISSRPGVLATPASHWAAGPTAYLALVVTLAKLARAAELASRVESAHPWLILPATIGHDAVLIGTVGLLAYALGHVRNPWIRLSATLLLLVPIGLLLPSDVVSHILTGRGLTLARLRGDEGATVTDLRLLGTTDLVGGVIGIALALLSIWPALKYGPRSAWVRRWARPRALMVTLIVGFCASLGQAALLPRTQGLAEQPVFVLLGSFVENKGFAGLALTPKEWRAVHTPAMRLPPPPPAPGARGVHVKNVVLFLAEGVPFRATGFDARFANQSMPNPTPNLTRRVATNGVVFDRYYANWHASIQAIFSIACSAFPPMGGDIVRIKPRIDCGELSEEMQAHGVVPGLFHSGQFSFYNKLALLGRRRYAIEVDADEMSKKSKRQKHQWGIDDRAMVDSTLDWVDSLHGKRFAAVMIAVTPHYPYWVPSDFKKPFQGSSREQHFLSGVAFQDQVFEQLMAGLQQRGLYDDTLFIWLGDHGHYVGEPERETPGLREFYEPNLHVALAFINSKLFPSSVRPEQRRNSRLSDHPDLLPTMLDALGLPADPRHQGQSLLAKDFEPRRVFFGADDGKYVGFVEGQNKFVVDTRSNRTEYYDLKKDPKELHDVSDAFPERMHQYTDVVMRFARGVQARIESAPVLVENVSVEDVYDLFIRNVSARVIDKDREQACSADGECPGLGQALRDRTDHVGGENRRCVVVRVPPKGAIELRVKDRDTLDLMTGTILTLPLKTHGHPSFRIEIVVDGQKQSSAYVSDTGETRPHHPKPKRELRYRVSAYGQPPAEPTELCLQLSTLGSH